MTSAATNLDALAATVEWPNAEAAATARDAVPAGAGRLGELHEWLAATRGSCPPPPLRRPRCVVLGTAAPALRTLAASLDVGVREVPPGDPAGAFAAGAAVADDEVDSGTDLIVLAAQSVDAAAAVVVVSLLATAEPVALLPRGAAAVDTERWIAGAVRVRDLRRRVGDLRRDPVTLLTRLGDAVLATAAGLVLQAVVRRTPLVLDATAAVVAGLVVADTVSRAARWWQVADTSPDPVHTRAAVDCDRRPLLDLGLTAVPGTAGLLCVPLLRAAQEGWS